MNVWLRRKIGRLLCRMSLVRAHWASYLWPRYDKAGRRLASTKVSVAKRSILFHFREDSCGDRGVIYQIFHYGDYSVDQWCQGRALHRYYQAHLAGTSLIIVDAGANIGAASVYFDAVFPGCGIIAIEPEVGNCELARLNCTSANFKLIGAALGQTPGTLYLRDLGRSDWGYQVGAEGQYPVPVVTLANVLDQHCAGTTPFILKVDIEGAEQSLFSDETDWLDRFALVVIELHDWMQPGGAVSRSFYREISRFDFDILQRGENTFCFNNRLLRSYY